VLFPGETASGVLNRKSATVRPQPPRDGSVCVCVCVCAARSLYPVPYEPTDDGAASTLATAVSRPTKTAARRLGSRRRIFCERLSQPPVVAMLASCSTCVSLTCCPDHCCDVRPSHCTVWRGLRCLRFPTAVAAVAAPTIATAVPTTHVAHSHPRTGTASRLKAYSCRRTIVVMGGRAEAVCENATRVVRSLLQGGGASFLTCA
jgi:hypothetical protein